jgi:hypothetical protein
MYNQNSLATGAKWFFFLTIVILLGAFALGFNVKDAKWLNGEIASATANQMNVETDIDRQKAELGLQVLRTQAEIQVAEMKRQADYEAAKQQQELNAATAAAMQWSNFQAGLYQAVNIGLMVVMISIGAALILAGISAAVGLYKILNAKAQAIQLSQPTVVVVHKRQPSVAAQRARQQEHEERERQLIDSRMNQIISGSKAVWIAQDRETETLKPENYPWAV